MQNRNYLLAIKSGSIFLNQIPTNQRSSEICLEAIKKDWQALAYIPVDKRTDEIYLAAIKQDWRAIQYIPVNKCTNEMYLEAVKQDWKALTYVPADKCAENICLEAVKQSGVALGCIPMKQRTLQICLAAVDQHPSAIKYVPNLTKKILLLLIQQNELILEYLKVNDTEYSRIREKLSIIYKNEREQIRSEAKFIRLNGDFYIKSLRGDLYNYFHSFADELNNSTNLDNKFPKRKGLKKPITVTGEGILSRTGYSNKYRLKQPQYTPVEKKGFTNFQSASFGNETYTPKVFGFDKRNTVLAGVLVSGKNILLSNRLFLYDGGTVTRCYDFFEENKAEAERYAANAINIKLFSKANFDQFKHAVYTDKRSEYNEAMIRIKWSGDGSCQIFIASDTLNSRLLAKQYADTLQAKFIKASQPSADCQVPICFYIPSSPDLHLKIYTVEEFELDKKEAQFIFDNVELRLRYFADNQYEFLLALSTENIVEALDQCALYMLKSGYVHILRFLLEKVAYNLETKLAKIQTRSDYQPILFLILEHVARSGDLSLMETILKYINIKANDNKHIISTAIENNFFAIAEKLIESGWFNPNAKNEQNITALTLAADKGQDKLVQILLKSSSEKNTSETLFALIKHGRTNALKLVLDNLAEIQNCGLLPYAIQNNLPIEIIQILLLEKHISIEDKDRNGNTAFLAAVKSGRLDIVELLLNNNANIHVENNDGETVFIVAQQHQLNEAKIMQLIEKHSENHITKQKKF